MKTKVEPVRSLDGIEIRPFSQESGGRTVSFQRLNRLIFPVTSLHYLTMNLLERITVEPDKCGGRPCIRGLRIRVTDILGMLAAGVSHEEILRDFPYLEDDDIKAALAYAAKQADHTVLQAF